MITFKRDKETGELIAYDDGQEAGKIEGMGDMVGDEDGEEQPADDR